MHNSIKEQQLKNLGEFNEWLEGNGLLDDDVLYRGQSDSRWPLESTLYRQRRNGLLAAGIQPEHSPHMDYRAKDYLKQAQNLQAVIESLTDNTFGDITETGAAFPFVKQAGEDREKAQSNDDIGRMSLEYAIHLRHHGCPSPLLDWTYSPYIALHFAFGGMQVGERAAVWVMRPPKQPYSNWTAGKWYLNDGGILHYSNPARGERHIIQKCSYTVAIQYKQYSAMSSSEVHDEGFCYGSHEYMLNNFPQEVVPNSSQRTYETSILTRSGGHAICWKLTIPRQEQEHIVKRLDKMNINKYTLFRTEDALYSFSASAPVYTGRAGAWRSKGPPVPAGRRCTAMHGGPRPDGQELRQAASCTERVVAR